MALEPEELEPRPPQAKDQRELETMSIDELESYIAEMESEIGRVREVIAQKKGHKTEAETFFKR